ncbi:MAG: hypothetical protein NTV33_01765 [Coprothermobacterota bacterium]|nr:hypothetical protein [Coprothermobacterota bacterium]
MAPVRHKTTSEHPAGGCLVAEHPAGGCLVAEHPAGGCLVEPLEEGSLWGRSHCR